MSARRAHDALGQLCRCLATIGSDAKPSRSSLAAASHQLRATAHPRGVPTPAWSAAARSELWQSWNSKQFSSAVDASEQQGGKVSTDAPPRVDARLAMVFTCTKCDTRSVKTFSKVAYTRGLVLVRCPGCEKLHLVSDHLGWFGAKGWTIEQLAHEAGVNVKTYIEPPPSPSTSSDVTALDTPAFEDWAGWSRVQSLLEVAGDANKQQHPHKEQKQQQTERQQQLAGGDERHMGGAGSDREHHASSVSASAGEEVWEVDPGDLERWRKVRETKKS